MQGPLSLTPHPLALHGAQTNIQMPDGLWLNREFADGLWVNADGRLTLLYTTPSIEPSQQALLFEDAFVGAVAAACAGRRRR